MLYLIFIDPPIKNNSKFITIKSKFVIYFICFFILKIINFYIEVDYLKCYNYLLSIEGFHLIIE